jgi:sugar O-acyltransferase (sialic acid O-acetyltransferase NeuD family)
MVKTYIHGAGGFGREVAWLLEHLIAAPRRIEAFIEDAGGSKIGQRLLGIPVLAPARIDYGEAPEIFVAIGNPRVRRKVTERHLAAGAGLPSAVAADVIVHGSCKIGAGAIICRGSILTVDIRIGAHVHVNLDCTIGHDAQLDDYATLAPGVHVSGNVHIGAGAYIGTGATIINGEEGRPLVIGRGCVVAAGATVTRDVPEKTLVAGVPAVVKKVL